MQKDALNQEAEQLQGVNIHLDHPGAGLQGVWHHSVLLTEEGSSDMKAGNQPRNHHGWLPERGTAHVPALVYFSPLVVLSLSHSFTLSPAVSSP